MNEFIVWDDIRKVFLDDDDDFSLQQDGCLIRGYYPEGSPAYANDDFSYFNYIGKTDINDKKIYADSSILKMTISDEDGEHNHKGYFTYNELLLCYEFKEPFKDGEMSGNRIWRMEKLQPYLVTFKIIDTIQENKLGLIKDIE